MFPWALSDLASGQGQFLFRSVYLGKVGWFGVQPHKNKHIKPVFGVRFQHTALGLMSRFGKMKCHEMRLTFCYSGPTSRSTGVLIIANQVREILDRIPAEAIPKSENASTFWAVKGSIQIKIRRVLGFLESSKRRECCANRSST